MQITTSETKKIIDKIPSERLVIAKTFLLWLSEEETLSQKELAKVLEGERQIAKGQCVAWREIAKTV